MRIRSEHVSGPDDETKVPCPCCAKGMVSPKLAAKVRAVLTDRPPPLDDATPPSESDKKP